MTPQTVNKIGNTVVLILRAMVMAIALNGAWQGHWFFAMLAALAAATIRWQNDGKWADDGGEAPKAPTLEPKAPALDDMLESVSVHDADEIPRKDLTGWYGVSSDDAGGVTAYFSTESEALWYRLALINHELNRKAGAR